MIVVRVELHSAKTGEVSEIARAIIDNQSGGGSLRDYRCRTFVGRSRARLDRHQVHREGAVHDFPSKSVHVWNLVAASLAAMGYGRDRAKATSPAAPGPMALAGLRVTISPRAEPGTLPPPTSPGRLRVTISRRAEPGQALVHPDTYADLRRRLEAAQQTAED